MSPRPSQGEWRPGANRAMLERRARLLADTRAWFASRGVLEVETPTLSRAAVSDRHIDSVPARLSVEGGVDMFLHTSPEYPMKRLLAAGAGDIYQVCRVYRDGEAGRRHNPEFTLLEWYRVGMDERALMADVESYLRHVAHGQGRALPPSRTVTYAQAFRDAGTPDPLTADAPVLVEFLESRGVAPPDGLDSDALLDLAMAEVVEPGFDPDVPTFVCDYPASQAALARIRPGDPPVAARFELFLGGLELANGFHELARADEQRARFEADLDARRAEGRPTPPLDERFLAALAAGLPDCAGVALGMDRLLMALTGTADIDGVLAFGLTRA